MEIAIRDYSPETDDGYIYSTWIKYAWYSPKEPIQLNKPEFFKRKTEEINSLLIKGRTKVACIKEDPAIIMGYCVVSEGELKWICVKKDFRNQGIEELLKQSLKGYLNEPSKEIRSGSKG